MFDTGSRSAAGDPAGAASGECGCPRAARTNRHGDVRQPAERDYGQPPIRRGITQAELGERIGMRRASIARIEAGSPALVRTARRLAEALNVEILDLQTQPPEAS
jgi:DNA-binding XRE family transcriptional regulator